MIDPKALRIGNWVMTKNGLPVQVLSYFDKSIRNDLYTVSNTDFKYEEDDCEGIQLTPDIFKLMDVADAGSGWYSWTLEDFDFSFDHQGCMNDGNRLHDYPIIYLHQLQNFFYAKTGKELEINL